MKIEEVVKNISEVISSGTEEGGSSPLIAKRKRTKRQRIVVCGLSSEGVEKEDHRNYESSVTTEEDEDTANCLILLARSGDYQREDYMNDELLKRPEKKLKNMMEISSNQSGIKHNVNMVYECKTCDKTFQSFQALGGHRASHHKKPKLIADETKVKPTSIVVTKLAPPSLYHGSMRLSSSKMHECSICGSAFSSGQALGGHMRRHRTAVISNNDTNQIAIAAAVDADADADIDRYIRNDTNKKFMATLDLNLPAPAEEDQHLDEDQVNIRRRFIHQQFATTGQNTSNPSTTAPALVGCYF